MKFKVVRLLLGDQLNANHSWFQQVDDQVLYVLAELKQENEYVTHHIQKTVAFFLAMESFANARQAEGHQVLYLDLDQTAQYSDLNQLITQQLALTGAEVFEYQRPDEFRLHAQLADLAPLNVAIHRVDSEHFLLPFDEIATTFPKGKHKTMEHFYRRMRQRFAILMDGNKPVGGKWNFDANNRKKLSTKDISDLPDPLVFKNDIGAIKQRLARHGIATIGHIQDTLGWPINRTQSLTLLAHFCQVCLPRFGHFQDAMTDQHRAKWSLYHSRLSFALNSKMLHPQEVIQAAIDSYKKDNQVDIAQVEGFVRQLLGWREYIRGVYWSNMPDYKQSNTLQANRPLPSYFWSGQTKMRCMQQAISQSLDHAYAHHIQRLMVTGNFCLLTGIAPDQVDAWYLGIYVDAIEWVELPNTRGMALCADDGIVGTKPYAASGSYINRMSDYCNSCQYDVKARSGKGSCPFNSLYWRFMETHRQRFVTNPRIAMLYRTWDNMAQEQRDQVMQTANDYLIALESL